MPIRDTDALVECLPCPFCGCTNIQRERDGMEFPPFAVWCVQCGASIDADTDCIQRGEQLPFDRWNARILPPTTTPGDGELIDRLRRFASTDDGTSTYVADGPLITEAAEALSHQKAAGDAMAEALAWWRDHIDVPHSQAEFDAAGERTRDALTDWNSIEQGDGG